MRSKKFRTGSRWFIWAVAVLLLVTSGITYRLLASHLNRVFDSPISLPVPLDAFPKQVGDWVGTDLAIHETSKEYMEDNFADDYFCRHYVNSATKAWADVYLVYCSSRPGGLYGHQPMVCYPNNGWDHDGSDSSQFTSRSGRQIICLTHKFNMKTPEYRSTVVLNFYILNGQTTADESGFSGPFGRRPNISGDPARYVAQVQISSVKEDWVRQAAVDMADLILDHLPDENGKVRAAERNAVGEQRTGTDRISPQDN